VTRWVLLAAFVAGCIKPRGPIYHVTDPETVTLIARTRPMPQTLRARFSVRIQTESVSGTVPGSLLLDHPNRLRAEIYTPLGTPLMYLVSDGEGIHAWDQRQQTFYRGEYAGLVLRHLTGGAVGLDDLLSVLTARLPMPDSEILYTGRTVFAEGGVELMMVGPDEMSIRTVVHSSTGVVQRLQVWEGEAESELTRAKGGMIIDVQYEGEIRVGRARLPERVVMIFPQLKWTITVNFRSWSTAKVSETAFGLTAPPGARIIELAEALRKMSRQHTEHLEP
jgi:hypothetical protein